MQEQSGIIVVGSLNPTKICQDECLVYGEGGVCPALRARDYKGAVKIMEEIICVGNYNESDHDASRVVDTNGIAPAVRENHGTVTAIVEEDMKVKELGFYDSGTGKHQSNTVYDTNGVVPALTTIHGGGTQQIKIVEDKTMVIGGLQEHQNWQADISPCINSASGMGGGQTPCIAEPGVKVIGQMDNTVDHTHESANRVYDTAGCSPSLTTCGGGGLQPKIVDDTYGNREPRAYDDVSPAIRAEREGFKVVASRGRNPDNPNDRRSGIELEQRLEVNEDDIANTLSTVQKDNMLLEPMENRILIKQATEQGYIECENGGIADLSYPDSNERRGRVQEGGRVSPALTCGGIAGLTRIEKESYEKARTQYRIRKLTPRECWRLMSFTDEEFDKAQSVNSSTQLYKQAGNSIVVDVLVALFQEIINSDGTVNTHSGEQIDLFDLL